MKMKKLVYIIAPAFMLMAGLSSCDKGTTTTTPTPTPTTPTTPTAPTPVTPQPTTGTGYWGVLVALQMNFAYSNAQLPMPVSVQSDLGVATFYDAATTGSANLVDAGKVSINGNDLTNNSNSYNITATTGLTPSSLSLGSSVKWDVGGSSNVNAFSYTYTGAFPEYTGSTSLPTSIDRSKDLEISLGTKVQNADSVYVVIVTAGKQIIKAYDGNPAPSKATITASELSGLSAVSDNSAYLEVVPFKYILPTISGKKYVFIKEAAAVTAVNIN